MLIVTLLLMLAINGGLFTGMILHSAYRATRYDRLLSATKTIWQKTC